MNTTVENRTSTDKVRWEQFEIEKLAKAWVEARKKSPFATPMQLFEMAQNAALSPDRHRTITSITAMPQLETKIAMVWTEFINQKDPLPEIIHVETQAPPDYLELSKRLDTPSLVAMLADRFTKELDSFKPLFAAMSGNTNGVHLGTPLNPPVSLLAAASTKPRKPCVLVMGPLADQFRHIEAKVKEQDIGVDLQWLDKDKPRNGVRVKTDFVIATRFIQHGLEDAIKSKVPKGCYFFLDEQSGITAVVQKCRDIASMSRVR